MTAAEPTDLEATLAAADAAASPLRRGSRAGRADALDAAARALDGAAAELVTVAQTETGLSTARLTGELRRTTVQLHLFADVVRDGDYLDVRIDRADPDFVLGPKPDLRRTLRPLGPCLNFAAGNFPFAFGVAGGDTAAALAAGCPVIVKAHPGYPETARRSAAIAAVALEGAGLPSGTLQLIEGEEAGRAALVDPRIRVATFTGSARGGRSLARLAAARPAPIPFYGELGSVNPVIVTATAVAERGERIATDYVTSVAGSAGQLCTKPGFLFVPAGTALPAQIARAAAGAAAHRLLSAPITRGYDSRRADVLAAPGVTVLAAGSLDLDDRLIGTANPTIVRTDLDTLVAQRGALLDEAFGPLSIVVEYEDLGELTARIPGLFPGELTASLHLGAAERSDRLEALVDVLALHAGRVLFDGWPTGVSVSAAQQHGGPWPATTLDATSVGTAAIGRFLRGVAFQSAPAWSLPEELRTFA